VHIIIIMEISSICFSIFQVKRAMIRNNEVMAGMVSVTNRLK